MLIFFFQIFLLDYKFDIKSTKYSKHLNIIFKNVTRKFNGNYYCHGTNYKTGVVKSNQISLNIQGKILYLLWTYILKKFTISNTMARHHTVVHAIRHVKLWQNGLTLTKLSFRNRCTVIGCTGGLETRNISKL